MCHERKKRQSFARAKRIIKFMERFVFNIRLTFFYLVSFLSFDFFACVYLLLIFSKTHSHTWLRFLAFSRCCSQHTERKKMFKCVSVWTKTLLSVLRPLFRGFFHTHSIIITGSFISYRLVGKDYLLWADLRARGQKTLRFQASSLSSFFNFLYF